MGCLVFIVGFFAFLGVMGDKENWYCLAAFGICVIYAAIISIGRSK